jgi:aspartate carbamoyltransferase regulatory subunit
MDKDNKEMYELRIDKIECGVVIDHIVAGNGMSIYKHLHLDDLDCPVAIIRNVTGQSGKKKDIIKIENSIGVDIDWAVMGYIDPNITVNVIKEGIATKHKLNLPRELKNVLTCKNPRCITSIEQEIEQIFILADGVKRTYRCRYCEQENK